MCVLLYMNNILLACNPTSQTESHFLPKSAEWKHSRIQLVSDQSQAELEERAGLFKGLKSTVQMLNFVVFHLFPVLDVLANDIWVTSGELGKSWDSALTVLPRSGPLPWTLMSARTNEMLPLRPETITADQYSRIFTVSAVLYWGLCGLGGNADMILHTVITQLTNTVGFTLKNIPRYWDQLYCMFIEISQTCGLCFTSSTWKSSTFSLLTRIHSGLDLGQFFWGFTSNNFLINFLIIFL